MVSDDLFALAVKNLELENGLEIEDAPLLRSLIQAGVSYAEQYQHLPDGYYNTHEMMPTTQQGIIFLVTHWYESRDGSTGGFFGNQPACAEQVRKTADCLFRLGRCWQV